MYKPNFKSNIMKNDNTLHFTIECLNSDFENASQRVKNIKDGESIVLVKDGTKIKVVTDDGYQIGYVPDIFNDIILKSMKNDIISAVIEHVDKDDTSVKICVLFEFNSNTESIIDDKHIDQIETKTSEDNKEEEKIQSSKTSISNTGVILIIIGVFLGLFMLIGMTKGCNPENNSISNAADSDSVVVDSSSSNDSSKEVVNNDIKKWDFTTEKDEMRGSTNVWASITSDDYASFDFPYNGGSFLKITVRHMKRFGTDVLLGISSGQFDGNDYNEDNYVTVRFDHGSPQRYYFTEPSDGSSDQIFIDNSRKFIAKLKRAKKIIIEAPFYQSGLQTFHFTVDESLNWKY